MVVVGLENLLINDANRLRGQRIGLVSHPAAVLGDLTTSRDALLAAGLNVTALLAAEHGISSAIADGAVVNHEIDPVSGLPVYSLYGETREPSPEVLEEIDLLIFDMQDVGVRFYTFLSTLYHVMRGCGRAGKTLIVLDRPNPIGGERVEGPLIAPGYESFVGILSIPIRHGMTLGELAFYMNHTSHLDVDLKVVAMQGWKRSMWFDQTGLTWVPTSPAMSHFQTTIPYPGTCLVEGTNLSEGRGTALPFEMLGAAWLDGYRLAQSLRPLNLPGVVFRPAYFEPAEGKFAHTLCQGVQLHVTERNAFKPIETGLHLLAACCSQAPDRFEFLTDSWEAELPHLDLLAGSAAVRESLVSGIPVDEITRTWVVGCREFRDETRPYLLYDE